jgi:prepilin-type N-terminal cleavage/methylation domain-containing protein
VNGRKGFTLVEILLVLLITAVLAAVSVGAYGLFTDNLSERDARANIDRVVLSQRAWALRNGAWTADLEELKAGRGLVLTGGTSTRYGTVSVAVEDGTRLGLATLAESGSCQGKVLGDPLADRSEEWVDMSGLPCTGQAALAAS